MEWIEIFKGGQQIDSAGFTHDDCDVIIDNAVKNFNIKNHEPPIVIGHPKENEPAWGWVSELKSDVRDGVKILLAKLKDVVPEFEELIRKGLYRKRSASFYPDGTLRHVGFLGAVPPAVKGLSNVFFQEKDDLVTFEFSEATKIKKEDKSMDKIDFSEMEHNIRAEYDAKIKALELQQRRTELSHFAEKFPPAWRESGIVDFMLSLDTQTSDFEFSEGKKESQVAWFKDFIEEQLKKLKLFEEIATKDKATDFSEENQDKDDEIAKKIAKIAMGGE